MSYIIDHIPKGKLRPGTKMTPTIITIHSTGNPNSKARNERDWLTNPANNLVASWHICVDEREAIEAIPLDEVAYHAGTKTGNRTSIGIEICESGNRSKTLDNAVKLVAKLLKERGWGVDMLKRHYDWSGKVCPRIMSEDNWAGWEKFKQDVAKELTGGGNVTQNKNQPSTWAKEAWDWAKKEGLLDGTRPKDNLTREEFAVVLKRLVDIPMEPITIKKEGKTYKGFLIDGVAYGEVRALFTSQGQDVVWRSEAKEVVITTGPLGKLREIKSIVEKVI